jgi:predicted GH43/DUF377 family glycosyl hydrolase
MSASHLNVSRTSIVLKPDPSRVLLRPFIPGDSQRVAAIVSRILAIDENQVGPLLNQITSEFSWRHLRVHSLFLKRFEEVFESIARNIFVDAVLSEARRMLIGAYFLAEYSVESAALFNPSLVPDPNQTDLPDGALRFVLSLRATGEGHISSVTFRTGIIHADNRIELVTPTGLITEPRQVPNPRYEKPLFNRKLNEMGLASEFTQSVMGQLGDCFALQDLRHSIDSQRKPHDQSIAEGIWTLARSNFEVQFEPDQQLSERILFPATPSQRNGIEDARFVCFLNDDGSHIYYATFTAFDGKVVMPELVETTDFRHFRFITLNGPAAQNKGMALFPRKIGGRYAMLSRQDNESIFIMFSDNVHFWNQHELLLKPVFPWELVQLGNCGSPIETDAGWLVLSHGVGAVRKYCIGAFLLDRDDPSKVIGRLREPLLQPDQNEREGYVPNVVYTCGALVHRGELIIPYGLADHATGFATIPVADVLAAMEVVAS